jgi:AraC-like DNA-binding protein
MELRWRALEGIDRETLIGLKRILYPPSFAYEPHRHDFLELFYVSHGRGFHDHDAGSDPLAPGDLVVVHPRLRHRLRAAADSALTFLNLVIAPRLAAEAELGVGAIREWRQPRPPPVRRLAGSDAQALMERLLDLERGDGCRDRLTALSFLLDLGWRLERQDRARGAPMPALARRLLAELDDPASLARGPSQIAGLLGCTREHLTRVTRRHLGASLVELLAERRLDQAARLLRHGGLAVSEVCRASGHRSVAHFYERFHRRFGVSPLRYRDGASAGPA